MAKWDQDGRPDFMDVAWTTEKSIQDELDRTSKAEVITMVISYLVMFVYIALALGRIKLSIVGCFVSFISSSSISQNYAYGELHKQFNYNFPLQTESRIVLSIGGIIVVIASVACSLGIFGYAGVSTTLLTIEVTRLI